VPRKKATKRKSNESIWKNPIVIVGIISAVATIIAAIVARTPGPPKPSDPVLTEIVTLQAQATPSVLTSISTTPSTPSALPSETVTPTEETTPTSTFTVVPMTSTLDPIVFFENFNSGLSPDWQVIYGEYLIINGQLSVAENGEFEIELDNLALTNYSLEMDVYLRPDTWTQIVFNKSLRASYQPRQSNRWEVYQGNNWEILTKWINNTQPSNFKLVIEVQGNSFELYMNGQLEIQIVHGDPTTNSIGIRMVDAGPIDEGSLDNFIIKTDE